MPRSELAPGVPSTANVSDYGELISVRGRLRSRLVQSGPSFPTSFLLQCPPFLQPVSDLVLCAVIGCLVIAFDRAEILLGNKVVRVIVCVLIAFTMAQAFCTRIMRVAQVLRHG